MTNNWCEQNQRGMTVITTPSFDQWERTGGQLSLVEDSLPFLIGDWINIGINIFDEDWAQATRYFRDKKSGTLLNYASICRKIPYEIRRVELTFSHHQHVRTLDEQDMMKELGYAADNEINSEDFRSYIRDKYYPQPDSDDYLDGLQSIRGAAEQLTYITPNEGHAQRILDLIKDISMIIKDYEFIKEPVSLSAREAD